MLGPPASGKTSVGQWVAKRLTCPLVTLPDLVKRIDDKPLRAKLEGLLATGKVRY